MNSHSTIEKSEIKHLNIMGFWSEINQAAMNLSAQRLLCYVVAASIFDDLWILISGAEFPYQLADVF